MDIITAYNFTKAEKTAHRHYNGKPLPTATFGNKEYLHSTKSSERPQGIQRTHTQITRQYDTNRIIQRTQLKENCTHAHQKQEPQRTIG